MSTRTLGILALFGSILCWGPAPVITKLGLQEIPPYSIAFLRFTIASAILMPFFLAQGHHQLIKKTDLPKFLTIGIFGSGLNVIFFMSGLSQTTATSSAAIFATVPLVNALAAFIFLREKPTLVRILGVGIGLIGSLIITLGPVLFGTGGVGGGSLLGNMFILAAVFSWVTYIITSKELLEKYSPLMLTLISFIIGAVCLFPFAVFEFINQPFWFIGMDYLYYGIILYAAIFISIVPFILFQWGMKKTSAFEAGLVNYINPVLATITAFFLLGEKPTGIFLMGTALILGGVFLASAYEAFQKRKPS